MAEDTQVATAQGAQGVTLTVPADTDEKFHELIELIRNSHSMDPEERQYWVDVLPIMSDEQIQNLRDILDNEKKQIEEAAQEYKGGIKEASDQAVREFDEAAYMEKKQARIEAETLAEKEETQKEEALLEELDNL